MIKRILLTLAVALALAGAAQAGFVTDYNYDLGTATDNGGTIADGNPAGLSSTLAVAIAPADVSEQALLDVKVSLDITGGVNGDLYGYLVSPTGVKVDLVDHLGTDGSHPLGNTSSGISVYLDASAPTSIQGVTSGSVSGPYQAAGDLTAFAAGNPSANGTWTLFLADTSTGGGNEALVSWGLELTTASEPVTWALFFFGLALVVWGRSPLAETKATAAAGTGVISNLLMSRPGAAGTSLQQKNKFDLRRRFSWNQKRTR